MKFGENLKSLLTENKLSQSELAKSIGYTQRAISKWICGQSEPTETAILKVAEFFDLPTDYLLGLSEYYTDQQLENPKMLFSERLKSLREEKGVTQKEVARACGFTPTCICQLESGVRNPTGSTIRELADYFQVSADFLLGRSDDFGNVNVQSTAPALANDEAELVALYRSLLPDYKALALTNLRTWAGVKSAKNGLTKKA